jgi:2'-5' RNA ligase
MKNFLVSRYFFTIIPPQPVQVFVSSLKRHVRKAIGHEFQDEFSTAHIALFKYSDDKRGTFFYDNDHLRAALLPFEIKAKGFGIFKHGTNRSIYLQIEYKTPGADVTEVLGGESIVPHIIIARNLDSGDFDKAWESLQSISCDHYFI